MSKFDQLITIARDRRFNVPGEHAEHVSRNGTRTLCGIHIPVWATYRSRHLQIFRGTLHEVIFVTTLDPTCNNCRRLLAGITEP